MTATIRSSAEPRRLLFPRGSGVSAIGFAGRGVERAVAAPFREASEACIACGACAVICPVGTIQVRIHADTGEAEISPFKSRSKLLVCEECGVRMVSVPVAQVMSDRVNIDWEEFRHLARLCPECRRKRAVKALSLGAKEGSVPPLEKIQVSGANEIHKANN